MTRVAWQIKKQEIAKAAPSVTRKTFLFNLSRSDYRKNWGATYKQPGIPLRANIDETVLPVVITEQGENRNQCEEQRSLFGFSHGVARRGT
jgi:hypothetical protein